MVKQIFKPIIFDIFSKKEQIATARTNSHGHAQIATACGGPLGGGQVVPVILLWIQGRPLDTRA
jgi:hypothetical protein